MQRGKQGETFEEIVLGAHREFSSRFGAPLPLREESTTAQEK